MPALENAVSCVHVCEDFVWRHTGDISDARRSDSYRAVAPESGFGRFLLLRSWFAFGLSGLLDLIADGLALPRFLIQSPGKLEDGTGEFADSRRGVAAIAFE